MFSKDGMIFDFRNTYNTMISFYEKLTMLKKSKAAAKAAKASSSKKKEKAGKKTTKLNQRQSGPEANETDTQPPVEEGDTEHPHAEESVDPLEGQSKSNDDIRSSSSEEQSYSEGESQPSAPQRNILIEQALANMSATMAALAGEVKQVSKRVKKNEATLSKQTQAPTQIQSLNMVPTDSTDTQTLSFPGGSSTLQPSLDLDSLLQLSRNEDRAGECILSYDSMTVDGHPHGRLSDLLKKKIWQDQFVDFHELLEKQDSRYALKVKADHGGALCLEPKAKTELSLADWKKAFAIYQSCYIAKLSAPEYSKEMAIQTMQDLVKYQLLIFKMAEEQRDWHYYDENFRKDRQESKRRFSIRDNDLFLDAGLRTRNRERAQHSTSERADLGYGQKFRPSSKGTVPEKWCFKYHKEGVSCRNTRCTYWHSCFKCSGAHPAYSCSATTYSKGEGASRRKGNPPPYSYQDQQARSPPRKLQR